MPWRPNAVRRLATLLCSNPDEVPKHDHAGGAGPPVQRALLRFIGTLVDVPPHRGAGQQVRRDAEGLAAAVHIT